MSQSKFEELSHFITTKMKMRHIYQPVMLRVLLENNGVASKQDIAKVLLSHDISQHEYYEYIVSSMVGKVLKQHSIVERAAERYSLDGYSELTADETLALTDLCQEKLDCFIAEHGDEIYEHRSIRRKRISGSLRYKLLKRAKKRCELCGVSSSKRALHVDHIVPKSKGGPNIEANYQVLCTLCNGNKGNRDDTDFRSWSDCYEHRDESCLFCNEAEERAVESNELAIAFEDAFPVTEGHTLIVPKRHVADYFSLEQPELNAINQLLKSRKQVLSDSDSTITGFNIGVNAGESAGQTIFHCHVHLIPRRDGDVSEPRGGVRGVIPGKQAY